MDEHLEANRTLWNAWHPVLQLFNDRLAEPDLRLLYPYFHGPEPIREEHDGCYAEPDAPIKSVEHVWLHKMSDVLGALLRAGLRIESFDECPFLSWRFFPWMEHGADGWWHLPEGLPLGRGSLPLMFSLKAVEDAPPLVRGMAPIARGTD